LNCFLKQGTKEKIYGKIEYMGRRRRISKQLLDDFKESIRYWKWKEDALEHTVWTVRFGRGFW
jgi:hypothetical protein